MHKIGLYKSNNHPIYLDQTSRFQHLFAIGQTGTGKSTFLKQSFLRDVYAGFGACYFDFHGQDAAWLLNHMPRERLDDVVYINPLNPSRVPGYNPLFGVRPEHHTQMTDEIVGSLRHIFRDSWGPRMDDILMNAIRPLFDLPPQSQGTLLGAIRMLNDPVYRRWVLKHCREKTVLDFWNLEYGQWTKGSQTHDVNSSLNKIRRFQSSEVLRRVLGQPRPTLNLGTAIERGQVVLIDCNKWKMGEKNASVLAALFLARLIYEASNRPMPQINGQPAANLITPFHIYIDEFHSITTTSTAEAFSGIRKFRVGITCCNQFTAQLQPEVLSAILGNVGTKVLFRVGSTDAKALHGAVEMPEPRHLTELPDYNFVTYFKSGNAMVTKRGVTTPLDAKRHGYQASLLRRMDSHFNRPIYEIDAAYHRWTESRHYSLIDPPGKGRTQMPARKKHTVKKKRSGHLRSIGAIMRDRFDLG
ncbi:MAG: hypothetical protein AAFR75_01135 [Pseudomonadota bacterium]